MLSWKRGSKGFSKRLSVNREKPRPSRRRITHAPGGRRREWKTSRARIRASNSSGLIVGHLFSPVQHLEPPRAEQPDVEEPVEPLGQGRPAEPLMSGVQGDAGHAGLAL